MPMQPSDTSRLSFSPSSPAEIGVNAVSHTSVIQPHTAFSLKIGVKAATTVTALLKEVLLLSATHQ